MDAGSLHRWFKKALKRAGLSESIKIHELRHSAADNLYRDTGNVILAQQLLRHASVDCHDSGLPAPGTRRPSRGSRVASQGTSLMKSCVWLRCDPAPPNGLPLRTHDNRRYVKLTDEDVLLLTPAPAR